MKKLFLMLIPLLLLAACAKDNQITVCTKVTPITPNTPATPDAIKLAQEFQVSFPNSTPKITENTFSQPLRICKSHGNCATGEYCITNCIVRMDGKSYNVLCPIDARDAYTTPQGNKGLCIDVDCKNNCNESINIPHNSCC